jgi:pimeloyl-ACP methyl ester carboxylesterase
MVAEMERGHTGSLRAAGRALGRFDGAWIAAAHDVPAAVVITRRDHVVRPERQERLAEAWRAVIVDLDADHDAPIAAPAAFTAAVLEGVERTAVVPT